MQFSDRARLLSGFTPDTGEIERELSGIRAKGRTALLDALALSAHQMKSAVNRRRVVLALSDGNDNNSRYSEDELRSMVMESDLQIYGIGLLHRPRLLQDLAEATGGSVLVAQSLGDLPAVVEQLSREIRSQYVLGYTSNRPNDGKYHRLTVELMRDPGAPALRLSWRRGYYAPEE